MLFTSSAFAAPSVPVASFSTNPTLRLSYDSKAKTPLIEGSAVVEISAPSNSDTKIYTISARLLDKSGNAVYTNASKPSFELISGATREVIDQSSDFSGNTVYKIKAGKKAKFKVSVTDNPEFMFGGVYKMSITNISFVKQNLAGGYDYDFTTIVPPTKTSNVLAIVGEKGPYISSTNSPIALDTNVIVTGQRFGKKIADNIIYVSGINKGGIASKDGKTITIPRDWFTGAFGKSNGAAYDNIQIENPRFGKSNIVYVEVKTTEQIPRIDSVSSPAAGNFEIDSEGKVFITGRNLIYSGKDTEVYIGGMQATVTQYNHELVVATAPKLALGSYDMYLTTSYGKSNIVKVKVITSTVDIDLTSTCPTTKFERDLIVGSSGNDVVALQTFLYAKGYSISSATGYFGVLTKSSLTAYQVSKGITPSDGSFGSLTRAAMTADCDNSIAPTITLLNPNGGQKYIIGGDYDISWTSSNMAFGDSVRIEIYKGGVYVEQIAFNQPVNGSYFWSPSTKLISGDDYKIRITRAYDSTNSVYDESDNYFSLINNFSVGSMSASYSPVTGGANGDTTGAAVIFTFTATNNGSSDVYISKVPGIALATSTEGSVGSSTMVDATSAITYVTVNPSTLAADTGVAPISGAYVIPAGASRTFTYSGFLDNSSGVAGIRVFKITGIRYGFSAINATQYSLGYGLNSLVVTPTLAGASVIIPVTPVIVSPITPVLSTSTPFLLSNTTNYSVLSTNNIQLISNINQTSLLATSSLILNPSIVAPSIVSTTTIRSLTPTSLFNTSPSTLMGPFPTVLQTN